MKTPPKVSVIIPTYNRATYLRKTLESVLQQTFSDYEIIIVDDGSTDPTENLIAQLFTERPVLRERTRYFFQRNQGKSVALNYGLSEARGEWIAFLDSDDLWLPTKLEEQFRALERFMPQSEACFTNARYVNDPSFQLTLFEHSGKRFPDTVGLITDSVSFGVRPNAASFPTILLHSRIMAKVGAFDPVLWTGQDVDFLFRLCLETKLCYVNAPLVLVDRSPNRSTGLQREAALRFWETLDLRRRMFEKWLVLSEGHGARVQKLVRSELRGVHSQQVNWLLLNGRYQEARRSAAMAARVELTPGTAAKWFLTAVSPVLARNIVNRRSVRKHLPINSELLEIRTRESRRA
jgi:glycosyltransferase involved in cell wall biosynthesis